MRMPQKAPILNRIVDYGNFDGQSPEEVVGKISEAMAAGAEY